MRRHDGQGGELQQEQQEEEQEEQEKENLGGGHHPRGWDTHDSQRTAGPRSPYQKAGCVELYHAGRPAHPGPGQRASRSWMAGQTVRSVQTLSVVGLAGADSYWWSRHRMFAMHIRSRTGVGGRSSCCARLQVVTGRQTRSECVLGAYRSKLVGLRDRRRDGNIQRRKVTVGWPCSAPIAGGHRSALAVGQCGRAGNLPGCSVAARDRKAHSATTRTLKVSRLRSYKNTTAGTLIWGSQERRRWEEKREEAGTLMRGARGTHLSEMLVEPTARYSLPLQTVSGAHTRSEAGATATDSHSVAESQTVLFAQRRSACAFPGHSKSAHQLTQNTTAGMLIWSPGGSAPSGLGPRSGAARNCTG